MNTHHALALAALCTLIALPAACGEDDTGGVEVSCTDAEAQGSDDAKASIGSCFECSYEAAWNVDAFATDDLKDCYANGFYNYYEYDCWEPCSTGKESDDEVCCMDAMDYVKEDMVGRDIWYDWPE